MVGEEFIFIPDRSREIGERKHKILEMLSHGWIEKEIAMELHVSLATVKRGIKELRQHFKARNTAHMVRLAFENGNLVVGEKEEDAGSKEG